MEKFMMHEYTYIVATAAIAILIGIFAILFKRRKEDDLSLDMPNTNGDPLFDTANVKADANDNPAGRWGDQIVGAPRVISAETPEERIARIHQEAAEFKAQQRVKPAATQIHRPSRPVHQPAPKLPALVTLYVMARNGMQFNGNDLYQALINAGLSFGKMRIFHYYEDHDPQRAELFSLASAVNPGTIDIDNLAQFTTPGLTLFLNVNSLANPKMALEIMIAVAEQLAEDLDGAVLNSQRQAWTSETERDCYRMVSQIELNRNHG
jgi:cell division protein ZipA